MSNFLNKLEDQIWNPYWLALVALYCAWLLKKRFFFISRKKNLPPSPPKLPIIGHLHKIGLLPHQPLATLSQKYGPLMLLHLGHKPVLVISSAAAAKEVVKSHDVSFSGRAASIPGKRLYYDMKGLLTSSYGDQWRILRSIFVTRLLHKRKNAHFNSIKDEEISLMVDNIDSLSSSGKTVNLSKMFLSLSNDTACRSAFGKKFTEWKDGVKLLEILEETARLLFKFTLGELVPWLAWVNRFNGFDAELESVSKTKDEIYRALIWDHQQTSNRELAPIGSQSGDNFLDILLGLHEGSVPGVSIDMDTVKAAFQDVILAGTDTIATTLEWAMTELIRHPKIMKTLQDEVRETMNGKQNITEDELSKMQYLKSIIRETLRLHPPITIIPRATIEDAKLMGYDIPSGTTVWFNVWAITRDPASWDEPEKFLPARFLNSSIDFKGSDFQFIPFGVGRRICPGFSFAIATIERVLANLMHKFDWQLPNGDKSEDLDVTEKPGLVVARKYPLIVNAEKC